MEPFVFFKRSSGGCTWLIVGLGNPGAKYAHSRHNVGFDTLDLLAEQLGAKVDRIKFKALTGTARIGEEQVLLLKPQTFMNLSGEAVRPAADFYKIPPAHILVLFDDISLDPGRIRVRANGSAGGHNGIKSIIAQLGSQDFPRVKVGVGAKPHPDYDLADWVLSRFQGDEKARVDDAMKRAAEAAIEIVKNGPEKAANRFNGK